MRGTSLIPTSRLRAGRSPSSGMARRASLSLLSGDGGRGRAESGDRGLPCGGASLSRTVHSPLLSMHPHTTSMSIHAGIPIHQAIRPMVIATSNSFIGRYLLFLVDTPRTLRLPFRLVQALVWE